MTVGFVKHCDTENVKEKMCTLQRRQVGSGVADDHNDDDDEERGKNLKEEEAARHFPLYRREECA